MKYTYFSIRINVIKYDVTFATNLPSVATLLACVPVSGLICYSLTATVPGCVLFGKLYCYSYFASLIMKMFNVIF